MDTTKPVDLDSPAAVTPTATWETARRVLPKDAIANDLQNTIWIAALGSCLRRYGAPTSAELRVSGLSDRGGGSHGRRVVLPDANAESVTVWLESIRRQLVDETENTRLPAREPADATSERWRTTLALENDEPDGSDPEGDSPIRRFAVSSSDGRIHLHAARLRNSGDDWPLEQMLVHWERLASSIAENPDQSIHRIPILTPDETERYLRAYEKPAPELKNPRFGFELFDEQARRTPDAFAVTDSGKTTTYRELWERTNRIARFLQRHGVGPEVIVGVFLERSVDLVAAVIGLHKAGGTYLPIDPALPSSRLGYVLSDSRPNFVITNEGMATKLPSGSYRLIRLDTEADAIAAMEATVPRHGLKPGNMSQVFYTSGSTGEPKGVMMEYVLREAIDPTQRSLNDLAVGETSLLKSTVGFTVILREIYWPLQTGGHVVVVPQGLERDTGYLVRTLREKRVVGAHFVPSMVSLLVDEPGLEACHDLRLIYTVGESLTPEVQDRLFERLPQLRLFVFYGCTEAPSATTREIRPHETWGKRVVVGKPMSFRKVYLLDEHAMPVPPGAPGEIHVGGKISRGYLHRPELTAQRFLPNPFAEDKTERFYQTGDLGRWLPDGNLEYLGRTDFQIQIGGARIELGEIETALRALPEIREAVVVAREAKPGDQRLVAYIIAAKETPPTSAKLRSLLTGTLPEYMVPSVYVPIRAWPLTTNGKLDRQALPPPDFSIAAQDMVEPRSPTERIVAEVWQEVLELPQVGVLDSFLDLGGQSLLAMKVLSRLRRVTCLEIPLPIVFENRTIAELAAAIDRLAEDTDRSDIEAKSAGATYEEDGLI